MCSLPSQWAPFPVQAKVMDTHADVFIPPTSQRDKLTSSDSQQSPWPRNQSYRKLSNNVKFDDPGTKYLLGPLKLYCNHIQAAVLTIFINVLVSHVSGMATLRRC